MVLLLTWTWTVVWCVCARALNTMTWSSRVTSAAAAASVEASGKSSTFTRRFAVIPAAMSALSFRLDGDVMSSEYDRSNGDVPARFCVFGA
jgi:hypothetical protein